jgi:hypothetical protein
MRFITCLFGLGISAVLLNLLVGWIVFYSPLFEELVLTCIKSGEEYYSCLGRIEDQWMYWFIISTQVVTSILLGYMWFRLMTSKAKEIGFDSILTIFFSVIILLVVAPGDYDEYFDKILWAGMFSIGPLVHYAKSRKLINK